jgi:HK97 gp10 family phage protein
MAYVPKTPGFISGGVKITVYGEEALYKAFDGMDDKLRKKGLRQALKVVGRMWRDGAKSLAPVGETGMLRKSITFATKIRNSLYGGVGKLWVGPRWNAEKSQQHPGFYGLFVELGTQGTPKRPFKTKAQSFLGKTFNSTKDEALKKFGEELWAEIRKAGK